MPARTLKRYSWAQAIVRGWKNSTKFAMQQERQFFVDLIPGADSGPASTVKIALRALARSRTWGRIHFFIWNVTDPDYVKCKRCGTIFPNDEYPETGITEVSPDGANLYLITKALESAPLDPM